MYTITRFGTITLPTCKTEYTTSPVPAQLNLVQTASGVFDNDGTDRRKQAFPHPLSYKAYVVEDDLAVARPIMDDLRAAVATRARLYRTADNNGETHYCWAVLAAEPQSRPWGSGMHIWELEFSFQQMSPWIGAIHGVGWKFDTGIKFDNGRTFDETPPVTLSTNPLSMTKPNAGNLPVTDIRFVTTAGGAPITAIQIDGPGFSLIWTGNLPIGSTVEIDAGAAMVLKNGSNDYNAFRFGPGHTIGTWAQLLKGDNTVTVTLTGGSTDSKFSMIYYDKWA